MTTTEFGTFHAFCMIYLLHSWNYTFPVNTFFSVLWWYVRWVGAELAGESSADVKMHSVDTISVGEAYSVGGQSIHTIDQQPVIVSLVI